MKYFAEIAILFVLSAVSSSSIAAEVVSTFYAKNYGTFSTSSVDPVACEQKIQSVFPEATLDVKSYIYTLNGIDYPAMSIGHWYLDTSADIGRCSWQRRYCRAMESVLPRVKARAVFHDEGTPSIVCDIYDEPIAQEEFFLVPEIGRPSPSLCDRSSSNTFEGNPIDAATGIKVEVSTDLGVPGDSLSFRRVYRSGGNANADGELGVGWSHNLDNRVDADAANVLESTSVPKSSGYRTPEAACTEGWLELQDSAYRGLASTATPTYSNGLCALKRNGQTIARARVYSSEGALAMPMVRSISRPDGSVVTFEQVNGKWQPVYGGDWQLIETTDGWQLADGQGNVEHYDIQGRIVSTTNRRGETTTYTHNADGQLSSVTSPRGRSLSFTYDAQGRISTVTGPDGSVNYAYDADNRLSTATYPDGTSRKYVYEDSRFPWALTGIIDEKGVRYASWSYDAEGRAISSQHPNGAERVDVTYNADGSTTVTDATGGRRTYHFQMIDGQLKPTQIVHE